MQLYLYLVSRHIDDNQLVMVCVWCVCVRDKKRLSCVICKAVGRLTCHHLGSVAFGSLIITLIKIPRYILMYIQNKKLS